MAVHLPVLHDDPFKWPRTVADCATSPRPCPIVRCEFNLLLSIHLDGSLSFNLPSGRTQAYPPRSDYKQDMLWYVAVSLPAQRVDGDLEPQMFALGPCGTRPRAKKLAAMWENENGPGTAKVSRHLPDGYKIAGEPREGSIDRQFADQVEDAVDQWFDEPDPDMPSCLLDEIKRLSKLDNKNEADALLIQIGDRLGVSRERIRQDEDRAKASFVAALEAQGMTVKDLMEER